MQNRIRRTLKERMLARSVPICASMAMIPAIGAEANELPPAECESRSTTTIFDPQTEGTTTIEEVEECPPQGGASAGTVVRDYSINLLDRIARQRGVLRGSPDEPETASLGKALGGAADASSSIADAGRLSVFGFDDYAESERDETANARGLDQDVNTAVVGFDYRIDGSLIAGATLSRLDGDTDIDDNAGSSESTAHIVGIHGSKYWDNNLFLDGLISYGSLDIDLERSDGINRYQASTDGQQLFADLSLGYQHSSGRWRLTPIAKFFYLRGHIDDYRETVSARSTGSSPTPQTIERQYIDSQTTELSLQTEYIMLSEWGVWVPSLKLAYQREFADANKVKGVRGASGSPAPFSEQLDDPDEDVFTGTLGLSAQFQRGWSAFFAYEYLEHDFRDRHNAVLGVRYEIPAAYQPSPLPDPGPRH